MPDQDFKYFRLVLMQETLYAKMLDGWEQRMGVDLVRDSLSMLRMARKGLSQRELEELLQIEETGRTAAWLDLAEALHTGTDAWCMWCMHLRHTHTLRPCAQVRMHGACGVCI